MIFSSRSSRRRRLALATVLWLFGIATTVLLVGLWGRSVAADRPTLQAAAFGATRLEAVQHQLLAWSADALAGAAAVPYPEAAAAVSELQEMPAARRAFETLVDQLLTAAFVPPGTTVEVDVGAALQPLARDLAPLLSRQGIPVDRTTLEHLLDSLDPLVVEGGSETSWVGGIVAARRALSRAVALAAAGVLVFGGLAVRLAEDRRAMVRSLGSRLALSALSFTVMLRVGAWALDPGGGGSPVRAVGATLLEANPHVPLMVAAVGSGLAYWGVMRRRRPADDQPVNTATTSVTG